MFVNKVLRYYLSRFISLALSFHSKISELFFEPSFRVAKTTKKGRDKFYLYPTRFYYFSIFWGTICAMFPILATRGLFFVTLILSIVPLFFQNLYYYFRVAKKNNLLVSTHHGRIPKAYYRKKNLFLGTGAFLSVLLLLILVNYLVTSPIEWGFLD